MKLRRTSSAFTLLEIMIVVTLIGVLAAMAIPNLKKSMEVAQAKTCITNLRNIEAAKIQWMGTANKTSADIPLDEDLFGEDKFIRDKPKCGSGGIYDLKAAGAKPMCNIPGHSY
jgi:prepilin-type N-terminal cleavage/methylation domain-containing protein